MPQPQKRDVSNWYPGHKVPLGIGEKQFVTVFPIGLQHIDEHTETIKAAAKKLIPFLDSIQIGLDGKPSITDEQLAELIPLVAHALRSVLMDFVNEFIDVDIYKLSFEHQGKVIAEWLSENFFKKPLLEAWGGVIGHLWRTVVASMMTSPTSPPPASTSTESSTDSTLDSLTKDAAGGNLEITVTPL